MSTASLGAAGRKGQSSTEVRTGNTGILLHKGAAQSYRAVVSIAHSGREGVEKMVEGN